MRSLVYFGQPDYFLVDQASAYRCKGMRKLVAAIKVHMVEARIEFPGKIGTVERYHAPLRLAYERVGADAGR